MIIKGNLLYIPFDELRKEGFSPIHFSDSTNKDNVAKFMVNRFNQDNDTEYVYRTIIGIAKGMIVIRVSY